jgi:hypothetical protein
MFDSLEADILELRRLRKLRRQVELPAYLFERHAPKGCTGECEHPLPIIPVEVGSLTCCHLWAAHDLHQSIIALERTMRLKVEQGRDRERCLAATHDRDDNREYMPSTVRGFPGRPPIETQVQMRFW